MNEVREDTLEDVEECFRSVVRVHGRSLFALVMNAGMAGEAMAVLGQGLAAHPQAVQALRMLGGAFNQLSNAYCVSQGWTDEQVRECDQAIKLAFQTRVLRPESSIVLQ